MPNTGQGNRASPRRAPSRAWEGPQRILEKLRVLCLSLPETSETQSWGHPNFRAGKRTFAVFEVYDGRPCISAKVEDLEQQLMLADKRFFKTPYSGNRGWISIWVDSAIDWNLVKAIVMKSYRLVALKRMIAALEERGS